MYKQNKFQATTLKVNESFEGESIEKKMQRVMKTGEPIEDGGVEVYYPGKEIPFETNVRTDRFDIALEMMDANDRAKIAESGNAGGKEMPGESKEPPAERE